MFEVGITSIIVLAVGYWVTLWLMGRHDDVLHGDFVHAENEIEALVLPEPPVVDRPRFPPKPVIKQPMVKQPVVKQPVVKQPVVKQPVVKRSSITPVAANRAGARPIPAKLASAGTPSTASASASPAPPPPHVDRTDTLQTLLASIKRDLKDASQL